MVTVSIKSSEIFTLSWELATIKMSKLNAKVIATFLVKIRKKMNSIKEKRILQHDIIGILKSSGIKKIPTQYLMGRKK